MRERETFERIHFYSSFSTVYINILLFYKRHKIVIFHFILCCIIKCFKYTLTAYVSGLGCTSTVFSNKCYQFIILKCLFSSKKRKQKAKQPNSFTHFIEKFYVSTVAVDDCFVVCVSNIIIMTITAIDCGVVVKNEDWRK